jgi:hypothetical protein
MFKRLATLFFLLMASASAALINSHPFFYPDTSNYVRDPDFAVVYFLGKRFATSWTQERTLQGAEHPTRDAIADRNIPLNSPFDKAVLAGRSIYYGALLYLGHVTSYFWLTVFAQALVFLYLSHTFMTKCLQLSFASFACATLIVLLATPVSFFISFLMPDIFASFLILGTIIVVGFWDVLKLRDRIFVSTIILYSALTHTSHLLLLVCLTLLFSCVSFIVEGRAILSSSTPRRAMILFALVVAGVLGGRAFSYGVRYTIGVDPIQPPFLMARVIADGPGYQFLRKNCATKPYVICNYIDRLPTPSDPFLWSTNSGAGIFNVVDLATRRALSSEQYSFVYDVFRFDPIGVAISAIKNFVDQLLMVKLDEFFPDQPKLQYFAGKLPAIYFDELFHSYFISHNWNLAISTFYSSVYFLSFLSLVLTWAVWPLLRNQIKVPFQQRQWYCVLTIAVAATLINAAICGALSEPNPRYQTRIAWIPLFILVAMGARLWEALSGSPLLYPASWTKRKVIDGVERSAV